MRRNTRPRPRRPSPAGNALPTACTSRWTPAGRISVLAGLVGAALLCGCEPVSGPLFDPDALLAARKVVVLPLADAPGVAAQGSGRVVRGIAIVELGGMEGLRLIDLPTSKFAEMVASAGYDEKDCHDPTVAAAVAREIGADAALSGELSHYGTQKEYSGGTVMLISGGGTSTNHLVGVSFRIVRAADGKIIYAGTGSAVHPEGYTQASMEACGKALGGMKQFLQQKRPAEEAAKGG